jgi:DNA replication licensing factor MCM4
VELKTLIRYISYARKINPVLSDEAAAEISQAYVEMRHMNASGKTVSATTRQLESMIRMSEAHARMRLSRSVDVEDVKEAVRVIKDSILSYAIDPVTGIIDLDVVMTGKSSAVREQLADLKKAVKDLLSTKSLPNVDFNTLIAEVGKQSTMKVEESHLREVLSELADEEFVHVAGKKGNVLIRRLI